MTTQPRIPLPSVEPLSTSAVRRARDAAHSGGRVTSVEVASLAEEVLRHRRDQRKRVRASIAQGAAVAEADRDGVAPVKPGPPQRQVPLEVLARGVQAYRDGANLADASALMGVSGSVGRRLLDEAGVEIRRPSTRRPQTSTTNLPNPEEST